MKYYTHFERLIQWIFEPNTLEKSMWHLLWQTEIFGLSVFQTVLKNLDARIGHSALTLVPLKLQKHMPMLHVHALDSIFL
jgi:hypothetical protein